MEDISICFLSIFDQYSHQHSENHLKVSKNKLLTLLKTWYIYYPQEVLNTIYNELGLSTFEVELLTPEDHQKIKKFIDGVRKEQEKNIIKPVPQNTVPPPHPNMQPKSTQK